MNMRPAVLAVPAAMTAVLAFAPSAGAGSETHFTGTFNKDITGVGCVIDPNGSPSADDPSVPLVDPHSFGDASGTWRVNVGTNTASARFVIYINGAPHVAFTQPMAVVSGAPNVVVTGSTLAGDLTVSISNGTMTYRIDGYDSTSFMNPAAFCPTGYVTYTGKVTG